MPTPYTTLISVEQLQALQASGAPLKVFDCSFELMQPDAADRLFAQGDPLTAAKGHFVPVYVDSATRRPVPLPAPLKAVLEQLL